MGFETFNLHPSIMDGVREVGYVTPTPIQVQAIPPIMKGSDLIGLAQTGTGKTAAFVLPILQRLLAGPRGQVRALILSPTRELAEQTNEAINTLGQQTKLRSVAVYGGVNINRHTQRLRSGVEIVVACPGRLLDYLWKGTIDLSHLEILVIDEADRMFDMGFLPDIHGILRCIMNKRQTLLFAATMPKAIRELVQDILHNPVTVQIGRTMPAATVSHALYPVKPHLKSSLLMELLCQNEMESVIVFTRTKLRTDRVTRQLQKVGFRVASLHGDLPQLRRQKALDGFRSGLYKILVATDIAARGIDVSHISHVINYDMPENTDAYIHRIGRTGRMNNNGDECTFVTSADTASVHALERILNRTIERRTLQGFDYTAAAPGSNQNQQPPHNLRRRTVRKKRVGDSHFVQLSV